MEVFKTKHAGCYGIVTNEKNEVLLIRKSRGAYKGKLDLTGGGIDYGETAEDTLKREFNEEVGVEINNFELFKIKTNYCLWNLDETHQEDLQHIAIIYKVSIGNDKLNKIKMTADGEDSLGANWYKLDNLKREDLSEIALVLYE